MNGDLNNVNFDTLPLFNLAMPKEIQGVPSEILNPRNTWKDKSAYDSKAANLAESFVKNFSQYASNASQEIMEAAPKVQQKD